MKKRRLADLYITGRPCKVDDGTGDSVEVWLQKPSPIEHETCIRRANAARARTLIVRQDRQSEEWQSVYSDVEDAGDREWLISYLIAEEVHDARSSVEARLAAEEEWNKDDYLQGLYDAWEGTQDSPGLKDDFARDPEHEEAKKVFEAMKAFTDLVNEEVEANAEVFKEVYEDVDDETLRLKAVERWLEAKANSAWLRELSLTEIFYAVREPDDHNRRYFDRREDVDLLAPEVLGQLRAAYNALSVEPLEGKDSEVPVSSSLPSDQPGTAEPAPRSGLKAVGQ